MKRYVIVRVSVIKQLTVEGLTDEQILEDRDVDVFEYATDEVEIDRTDDWEVLEIKDYVPLPGEASEG